MKKIILNRQFLSVAVLLLLLTFLTVAFVLVLKSDNTRLKTDKDRKLYIESLGIANVSDSYTVKSITIPTEFSVVYTNYNKLQNKAGFDLLKYRGVNAKLYSYLISDKSNAVLRVNLIVYKNTLIGGDVSGTELSGEMLPLLKKEIKKCLK